MQKQSKAEKNATDEIITLGNLHISYLAVMQDMQEDEEFYLQSTFRVLIKALKQRCEKIEAEQEELQTKFMKRFRSKEVIR